MRLLRNAVFVLVVFLCAGFSLAIVFGTVRGVVHDPQHRPIANATVVLKSANSAWTRTAKTNDNGEFTMPSIPLGQYSITVTAPGFSPLEQTFTLDSATIR